jgi:hypothetical protein
MAARLGDGKRSSGGVGCVGRPRRISLTAGTNRLSAAKKHPPNIESLFVISGLGTIWHSSLAAELKAAGRGLAAEFGTRYLACIFGMKISFRN